MAEKSAKEPLQWLRLSWLVLSRLAGQASRYLAGLLQLLTGIEIIEVMKLWIIIDYWFILIHSSLFYKIPSTTFFCFPKPVLALVILKASAGGIVSRRAATTASHVHFPKQSCCRGHSVDISSCLASSCVFFIDFMSSSIPKNISFSLEVAVETKLRRQEWRAASAASILRSMTIMWNCAKVGNLGLRAQNTKTEGQWQVLAWPFCWRLSSSFSRLVMGRSQKTSAIFWTRCHGMTRICADW